MKVDSFSLLLAIVFFRPVLCELESSGGIVPMADVGEECDDGSDCFTGRCDFGSGWSAWKKICYDLVDDGDSCNESSDCRSGRCDFEGFWQICWPQTQLGEACNEDTDCLSNFCTNGWFDDRQCADPLCYGMNAESFDPLSELNLSDGTSHLFSQLDTATKVIASTLPGGIADHQGRTDEEIHTEEVNLGWTKSEGAGFSDPWTPLPPSHETVEVGHNFIIDVLDEDDLFGESSSIEDVFLDAIRDSNIFPLEDAVFNANSDEDVEAFLNELKLGLVSEGGAFPDSYNSNFDMISDESFSRMFFFGFGVPIMAAQEEEDSSGFGPFVADMPIQGLAHRESFRRLGARVHFDVNQQVTAIYDYDKEQMFAPGDDGWEEAKFLARSTVIVLVTVREHLIWTHLIMANSASFHSTVELPPNHPIRRLLTIHTYRTTKVNNGAYNVLVPIRSLLHRGTGLTHEAMKDAFDFSYETSNIYEPFPNRAVNPALQALVDDGKFPFISEGIRYYNVIESFVTTWLAEAGDAAHDQHAMNFYEAMRSSSQGQKYEIPEHFGESSMVDLLTQIIWVVTAYHELVGYVKDVNTPAIGGFRMSENCDQTQLDIQAFTHQSIVVATTSLRMPFLMRDYPNFFGAGGAPAWERAVWNEFVEELGQLSADVQLADEERLQNSIPEFKHMDPARFECSVSV